MPALAEGHADLALREQKQPDGKGASCRKMREIEDLRVAHGGSKEKHARDDGHRVVQRGAVDAQQGIWWSSRIRDRWRVVVVIHIAHGGSGWLRGFGWCGTGTPSGRDGVKERRMEEIGGDVGSDEEDCNAEQSAMVSGDEAIDAAWEIQGAEEKAQPTNEQTQTGANGDGVVRLGYE